jgi:hypothetical protein
MIGVGVLSMTFFAACSSPAKSDGADNIRDALPGQTDLAISIPSSASSTGSTTNAVDAPVLHPANVPAGTPAHAQYYEMTRDITDVIDAATADVLVLVWAIVHNAPSSIEAGKATWGPGADALSPVTWMFVATEVSSGEYDYILEGRPHASTSDADFRVVLKGHGFDKTRAEHGTGDFSVDFDAARALDPDRNKDSGTLQLNYDLRVSGDEAASLHAVLIPPPPSASADVLVTHAVSGGGTVTLETKADLSTNKDGNLETVQLKSRYDATGAGRGEATLSGGDLTSSVTATECWDATFARVYYTDSANAQPTSGSASACVFGP